MRPPSPQLLRALRSSISATSQACRSLSSSSRSLPANLSPLYPSNSTLFRHSLSASLTPPPCRFNSGHIRPSRIVPRAHPRKPPASRDRGPRSSEETRTDLAALNVLGDIPAPASAIDACLDDGFHLSNGTKVTGGDGVLLVGGEAFAWRPWEAFSNNKDRGEGGISDLKGMMVNAKGQWAVDEQVWGLLGLIWPRPDLLILGLGASVFPISPETRRHINSLGIRIEVQDTRNAAAQFNLLATERGVSEVAAALIPVGWRGR